LTIPPWKQALYRPVFLLEYPGIQGIRANNGVFLNTSLKNRDYRPVCDIRKKGK
jgi:hypothetical protein